MQPRPYQIEAQDAVRDGWGRDLGQGPVKRQLLVMPTGAGKTHVAAHVAKEWVDKGNRVLFLAHREELLLQTLDKFWKAVGIRADLEKAEHHASRNCPVVVGSIQTFTARGYDWASDHFDLIIVDEAHHVLSDSYRRVLDMFPAARVLGITATPDRGDKRNLGAVFENIAKEVKLFDLIGAGYLSPIVVKAIPLEIDLNGVRQTVGDFNEADLGEKLEPYLDSIAAAIRDHASFRRVLGFAPLIATTHKCVEACRKVGLVAEQVDGESPDRREKLARFARGEFDVLWNAMLLTEGFDDPGIDCVVVLRPTRSRPLYAQMIGRGTRVTPSKENLLLLDFAFLHERHKLVKPAHLIASSEEEAEVITQLAEEKAKAGGPNQEELDLQGLAGAATAQRENALRKRLEEQRGRKAKVISAEEFALEHHRLDIAEYQAVMPWEGQPVTEKQAWRLKRAKIDLATVKSKGQASQIISILASKEHLVMASSGQRWKMKQMGHPNADMATQAEARKFFAALRGRESQLV